MRGDVGQSIERWYKVGPRNSRVLGRPGREFDWSKFTWNGDAIHMERCGIPGHPVTERKAYPAYADGSPESGQYLHVPYDWAEDARVFRVFPNDCMWPGKLYRGRRVDRQRAVLRDGVWWWVLEEGER